MRTPQILSCLWLGSVLLATGCQPAKTTAQPGPTPAPSASHTPASTITPVPTPTVTMPAPLAFHGDLSPGIQARFGQGAFGSPVLSPDGNYLAAPSGVGLILYQPETLREVRVLAKDQGSDVMAWSPDSKRLALAGAESVDIWDVEKARVLQQLAVFGISELAWSPDGRKLALADSKREIEVWDLQSSKAVLTFSGHTQTTNQWGYIAQVLWVDNDRIVSVDDSAQIMLWDANSGLSLYTWEKAKNDYWRRVALSPDRHTLAIVQPRKLEIWNLSGPRKRNVIDLPALIVMGMIWSPDGQTLALVAQFPSKFVFLDAASGVIRREFPTNLYGVYSPAWLKNGTMIATINEYGDGNIISVWDIQSGQAIHAVRGMGAGLAVWLPDGKTIAATDGKAIALWDVQTGTPRLLPDEIRNGPLDGAPNYEGIFRMAVNPSGSLLAAESGDDGSRVRVWDLRTGALIEQTYMDWHLDELSWLSDTTLKAQITEKNISIWEVGNWENRRIIDLHSIAADTLGVSDDGQLAAIVRQTTLEIRDLQNGQTLHTWKIDLEPQMGQVWWSPDATKLALLDADNLVVYEAASGKKLHTLKRDPAGPFGLRWSPDSSAIAYLTWTPIAPRTPTGKPSGTGKIYLWRLNAPAARLVIVQKGVYLLPNNLSFSPDSKRLALAIWREGLVVIQP